MHAPAKSLSLGRLKQRVLLSIKKVWIGQPGHFLPQRCVQLDPGVHLERPEIMLEASDQRDVFQSFRPLEGGKHVPYERTVCGDIFFLSLAPDPGCEKNLRRPEVRQRDPQRFWIKQI